MAYYLQSYGKGYIQRDGDKYELLENGEVVGTYKSIATLVQHNPVSDGKQAPKLAETKADTKTVVAPAPAKEVQTTKSTSATKK